jgi:hypothetical protein
VATDLGKPPTGPDGRAPRPRGAHAAAKSGRFRRGASAPPAQPHAAQPHAAPHPPAQPHAAQPSAQPISPASVPAPREIPAISKLRKALRALRLTAPRVSAAGLCAAALVAAVVPLAIVQIPNAIAWSPPSQFAAGRPNGLFSLLRAASLALPAMAVAAPFAALATRRFRAGPVLLGGLLAIGAADALGGGARTVLLIGVDRLLHGLGAGMSLAAVTAIVAERRQVARSLAGWWACAVVSALAAAPVLMRHRVAVGGWRAALQPYPWLAGAALVLAALYAVLAEGTARTAVRSAFPATERALLALLAAPVAGICTVTVAVSYRAGRAVVAAAIASAIALVGLAVISVRASTAGRFAAICAVTGFTVAPAAGAVAGLNSPGQPGWEAGGAALAAAAGGAVLALTRRPAQARTASAAGLFVAAAAFAAASQGVPAVTHAGVLALLCVPLAGGLGAAVAATMRGTGTGAAMLGIVLLLTGMVAGYLAASAVQFQALQHAQTATAVRTALVATSSRWALLAAGVTAAVALVIAVAPGPRGPARTTDSGARPVRRAGGTPDRG